MTITQAAKAKAVELANWKAGHDPRFPPHPSHLRPTAGPQPGAD